MDLFIDASTKTRITMARREVPPSDFGRDRAEKTKISPTEETAGTWEEGRRKWNEGKREGESGGGSEERRPTIGRDACESGKETVDQTSRASEASVWNEDVSISRQIARATLSSHFYYPPQGRSESRRLPFPERPSGMQGSPTRETLTRCDWLLIDNVFEFEDAT